MEVSIRNGERYYIACLTIGQARLHDNGALISCGLTVGHDLRPSTFKRWQSADLTREITYDEWNHGGCQSSCIKRRNASCRW
jgi:hypothetical protein